MEQTTLKATSAAATNLRALPAASGVLSWSEVVFTMAANQLGSQRRSSTTSGTQCDGA